MRKSKVQNPLQVTVLSKIGHQNGQENPGIRMGIHERRS